MKKEDIELWDWNRILLGTASPEFMLEVFLRTIVSFLLLFAILRLLGKKMNGQLNLTETAVMITLGAIISVPMQMPDRGILIGVIALICVLILQRFFNWTSVKSERLENATQGKLAILVRDG
ncbi:MAG TPA: hypothetical protein VFE50_23210 [Cyclobacteriaceae bacterium]|nr:hypothetical protein [Cyclobacteriaceae bacterium]